MYIDIISVKGCSLQIILTNVSPRGFRLFWKIIGENSSSWNNWLRQVNSQHKM